MGTRISPVILWGSVGLVAFTLAYCCVVRLFWTRIVGEVAVEGMQDAGEVEEEIYKYLMGGVAETDDEYD